MYPSIRFVLTACLFVFLMSGSTRAADTNDIIDLASYSPDAVWRCANSTISSRKDADGTTIWSWRIEGGKQAFLWLSEELPVHANLNQYQRLIYDVNFADG